MAVDNYRALTINSNPLIFLLLLLQKMKDTTHKILVRSSHKFPHFLDVVYVTAVRHLMRQYLNKRTINLY